MRKLVLVVEDENEIVEYLVEILETFGIEALIAIDGEQAVKLIDENINDLELAFIDVFLPGDINGIEVYDEIRKFRKDLHVILISGHPLPDFVTDDKKLHFIQKPFSYDDIELVLEGII